MYVTSPNSFTNCEAIHAAEILESGDLSHSPIRTVSAGKVLYYEGDNADYVYEVLEGTARSSKVLIDGRRQVVAFGFPGDLMGVSHDGSYHSECEALTDMKVRVHHNNVAVANIAQEPEFCELLMKQMAADVTGMQEHFMMLGRKSALEKVASFLTVLLERIAAGQYSDQFELSMSRADIADFLGLTVETVSRTLSSLREHKIIELADAHTVRVLHPERLADMAEICD